MVNTVLLPVTTQNILFLAKREISISSYLNCMPFIDVSISKISATILTRNDNKKCPFLYHHFFLFFVFFLLQHWGFNSGLKLAGQVAGALPPSHSSSPYHRSESREVVSFQHEVWSLVGFFYILVMKFLFFPTLLNVFAFTFKRDFFLKLYSSCLSGFDDGGKTLPYVCFLKVAM
jgi:hypothetical protein